jgi:PEP-CTERM motif
MLIGPQFFDGGPQPVPEPETLVPAGMALIALSLGLRRRIGKRQ